MKRRTLAGWLCLGMLVLGTAAREGGAARRNVAPDVALARKAGDYSVQASLGAVLTDFAMQAGVTVRADWAALEAAGVPRGKRVALSLSGVTWKQVLEVILSRVGRPGKPLGWRIDEGELLVSTQKDILRRRDRTNRSLSKLLAAPRTKRGRGKASRRGPGRGLLSGVHFDNAPLRDVLKFYGDVTGLNLHINWRAMETAGIRPDFPVSLNLKRISIGTALDLTFRQVNADRDKLSSIYWVVHKGVVLVSTGSDLNRELITRVIDAGGVLLVQPDVPGPRIDMEEATARTPGGSGDGTGTIFDPVDDTPDDQPKSYAEQKKAHSEKVIETVKTMIGPEMWAPHGKGTIRVLNNKLVISQTLLGFKLLEKSLR